MRDYEEELFDVLHLRDLDLILDQGRGVMVSGIGGALKDYLDRVTPALSKALDRTFSARNNVALPSFGQEYCRRYRGELQGLLRRGSNVLFRFPSLRHL